MKSFTLRPDTFTLNFNLLFQVPPGVHSLHRVQEAADIDTHERGQTVRLMLNDTNMMLT